MEFACGAKGSAYDFIIKLAHLSGFREALVYISDNFGLGGGNHPPVGTTKERKRSAEKAIAPEVVDEYQSNIHQVSEALCKIRRWSLDVIKERRIGYDPQSKRVTIPVFDAQGVCRNIRKYSPAPPPGQKKALSYGAGYGRNRLYPIDNVKKASEGGLIILCEGEPDVLCGMSNGLLCITQTAGAGSWHPSFNKEFQGCHVLIVYDNDEAGYNGMEKVAKELSGFASKVEAIEWPEFMKNGGDLTDWFVTYRKTTDDLLSLPRRHVQEPRELFPYGPFPWEVLPHDIAESLQQLARACATSATSLPAVAACIFASAIGSTVEVSPKRSWREPLIFWCCDIRPSGAGKTPAARALCRVLYQAQSDADEDYKRRMQLWQALPKKDRGEPPARARGYFVTDLTLEGLREDHSGHGGKVCVLDEVSAFVSSQNQYKNKGSDRESWLALYDGKPARIVRAGKAVTLSGSRISIFGGIQPAVWRRVFAGDAGQFLADGTVFRFLPTYGGDGFYPLTPEAWSDKNRDVWEDLLRSAMRWADARQEAGENKTLCLNEEAQALFLDWRNDLTQAQGDLPPLVRGFVPKLVGYALRFAGVLYLMGLFNRGEEPGVILGVKEIRKGIRIVEFYLGHIIKATQALTSDEAPEVMEMTPQVAHLAKTLEALKPDLDNGLLAVGYIQERFDATCDRSLRVRTPHRMGALLRKCGLTIPAGRYHCNGRHGVRCLKWDEKIKMLMKRCPQSPHSEKNQGVILEDIEESKSSQVLKSSQQGENVRTLRTLKDQSPQGQVTEITGFEDNEDNEDNFSNVREKNCELQGQEEVVL